MCKQEFLAALQKGLSGLPQAEREERIAFYSEMIDDRMEDGMPEDDAVAEIGAADDVVMQILAETPLSTLVKEKVKQKRALRAWEVVLLVLGSPLWLSILTAVFSIVLSVYVALWSAALSFWAADAGFLGGALGGWFAGGLFAAQGHIPQGVAMLGAGFVCAGLTIFWFFLCKLCTKGMVLLTKKILLGVKTLFIKRGRQYA